MRKCLDLFITLLRLNRWTDFGRILEMNSILEKWRQLLVISRERGTNEAARQKLLILYFRLDFVDSCNSAGCDQLARNARHTSATEASQRNRNLSRTPTAVYAVFWWAYTTGSRLWLIIKVPIYQRFHMYLSTYDMRDMHTLRYNVAPTSRHCCYCPLT